MKFFTASSWDQEQVYVLSLPEGDCGVGHWKEWVRHMVLGGACGLWQTFTSSSYVT